MKNNKIKKKWNSLPWYTRDVAWRLAATVGALVFLIGMSECAHNKKKNAEAKSNKATQVLQNVPEDYIKFREEYIKQQSQKQR